MEAAKFIYLLVGDFVRDNLPFVAFEKAKPSTIKGFITELEQMCVEDPRQLDVPIKHHFSKSVYAREMNLPAGAMIVGKIHRHENLNILSEGEVSVLDETGVRRLKAPATFVAPPGVKRVIYAHTQTTWTVIHGTDEKDLDLIEKEFIAPTYGDVVYLNKGEE